MLCQQGHRPIPHFLNKKGALSPSRESVWGQTRLYLDLHVVALAGVTRTQAIKDSACSRKTGNGGSAKLNR